MPIGRKREVPVGSGAEFFGREEFRYGGVKRGGFLVRGTLPQRCPAEAVFWRVPNEQQDFFACADPGDEDEWLPVEFVDERVLELDDLCDGVRDELLVRFPSDPQELGEEPFPGVQDQHRIHVICSVYGADVDGAAGAAELVDEADRLAQVGAIRDPEVVRPEVFLIFDFFAEFSGELAVRNGAAVELVECAREGLTESSTVELGGFPVAGEEALLHLHIALCDRSRERGIDDPSNLGDEVVGRHGLAFFAMASACLIPVGVSLYPPSVFRKRFSAFFLATAFPMLRSFSSYENAALIKR